MELQKTLNGETYNNTTNKALNGGIHKPRNTEHYLFILEKFYNDFSETGLSIPTFMKRTQMHENTIARNIQKLLLDGHIRLIAQNVGQTKRRKYYKITEEGAVHYEGLKKVP